MSKKGMARPDRAHTKKQNNYPPVPELSGKVKRTKAKANPIISGTSGSRQKVFHHTPTENSNSV